MLGSRCQVAGCFPAAWHKIPGGGTRENFAGGVRLSVLPLHPLLGLIIPKYDPSIGHFRALHPGNWLTKYPLLGRLNMFA